MPFSSSLSPFSNRHENGWCFQPIQKSQCGLSQIGWTITMLETTTQSQMLVLYIYISIRYAIIYISTCLLFRYSLFHSKCYILLGKMLNAPQHGSSSRNFMTNVITNGDWWSDTHGTLWMKKSKKTIGFSGWSNGVYPLVYPIRIRLYIYIYSVYIS